MRCMVYHFGVQSHSPPEPVPQPRLMSRLALAKRLTAFVIIVLATAPTRAVAQRNPEGAAPLPTFVKTDTMVAMRDGVRLHTNVYVPKGFVGNLPIMLIRTPYGIE